MPQNAENAYLVMKNPRASRALRWALDPGQLRLNSFVQLRCTKLAKRFKTFGLGPPLQKAGYGPEYARLGRCQILIQQHSHTCTKRVWFSREYLPANLFIYCRLYLYRQLSDDKHRMVRENSKRCTGCPRKL